MTSIEVLEKLIELIKSGEISGEETLFTTYYHNIDLKDVIPSIESVIINKEEYKYWGWKSKPEN